MLLYGRRVDTLGLHSWEGGRRWLGFFPESKFVEVLDAKSFRKLFPDENGQYVM